MCAKINPLRKRRIRNPPPMILPDDPYDYRDDRPQPRGGLRSRDDDRPGLRDMTIVDDWPERVPVTKAEIDVFERYFGDLLDEIFGNPAP